MIKLLKKSVFTITGVPAFRFRHIFQNHMRSIADFAKYRKWPMFRRVLIETSSFCNRKCDFCPVSMHKREKAYMDDRIFDVIVSELGEIGFSGKIGLHFFNEPLADKSIVHKVHILRQSVPNSFIYINSNGDYLTYDLLKALLDSGINLLFVSQYDGNVSQRIKHVLSRATTKEKSDLEIRVGVQSDFLNNRTGVLRNAVSDEPLMAGCYLPSNQLVINYKGEVVICCNDYFGKVILGKVPEQRIMEIWSGNLFKTIRTLLRKKRRDQIETCRKCNHLGNFYLYRDLTPEEIVEWNRGCLRINRAGRLVTG